jgi:hypothetical protein
MTTGLIKMVGGATLGFAIPWIALHHSWPLSLLEGAGIALCANAFNLLDLKPGRAGAVFLLIGACLVWLGWSVAGNLPPLLYVLIPALVVDVLDARGLVMLGDTGSNLIGAALGLELVIQLDNVASEAALVLLLVAFHILAERRSLSKIIESNRFLRTVDSWTGLRPKKQAAPD